MEAVYKSGGAVRTGSAGALVLDRPSIVFVKVGPEAVARYERRGGDLVMVLRDGKEITVADFFADYADGGRNDLVLEDAQGVLWWGQYSGPWSQFQFTEIEWTDAAAGLLPEGGMAAVLGALGLVGLGAAAGGGGGGGGGIGGFPLPPAANRAPEAGATPLTTPQDKPVNGQVAATDPDGDALTFAVARAPEHGTVSLDAATGRFVYTPAPGYEGADSFEVVVRDGKGGAVTVTVPVTVAPVNDAPAAADQSVSTAEDVPVSGRVEAQDRDGDLLTYGKGSDPAHGTVIVNARSTMGTGARRQAPSP